MIRYGGGTFVYTGTWLLGSEVQRNTFHVDDDKLYLIHWLIFTRLKLDQRISHMG